MSAPVRRAFAATLLALASSAFAGGPLQVCSQVPVKYPGAGTINLNYDLGNLGARTKAQADALISVAVANWTNVNTATVSLGRGPDLPVDVTTANYTTYLDVFNDGLNPVIYDTDGSLTDLLLGSGAKSTVLGFAGSAFSSATCQYLEGHAIINGFIAVSDAALRVVLAHEIGHLIGLDHAQLDDEQGLTQTNYPLMYPIAYRTSDVLHEDDAAAVTALYPEATVNATYGQVAGNLYQSNGVTVVRGANVWAREVATGKLYSIVSDYLQQADGFFKLLLPPGNYNLLVGGVRPGFTGGSSVGPYSETAGDLSFQPPLYNAGVRMTPVALGGGTPTTFTIIAGCTATAAFNLDGTGSIGGNCGSPTPEVFPPGGTMPPDFVPGSSQQRDLFINTGFESNFTGWTPSGSWIVSTSAPFAGAKHAQFSLANGTGGNNLRGDLYQTVSIPSGISGAAVIYQLAVQTQETTTTSIFDELIFEVRNTAGALLAEAPSHSNLDAGPYRFVGWNISQFAGQTVRINFAGFTDIDLPTVFRIDDVRLIVEANPTWTVASDQAQEGVYSLKSGPAPDGFRSDLVHSADFLDGNVSFARRVSSQAGGDFLRFYIDDNLQGQWSGEVDWSTVTFPVAAGLRTLRWSYQKNGSGSAGGDAAWIDSVSLPGVQGATYLVTVGKSGAGSGTVTSSPAGIDCGATCSASFLAGNVTLNAAPGAGSAFNSWTGACAGSGASCVLSLNGAKNTTAVFDIIPSYSLTVTVSGNGTVTSSPAGISCPGDCTEPYLAGTGVLLTATPGTGALFSGWSGGACTGTGTCNVSMSAARAVTATFVTDTTPDAFTFTDATNVTPGATVTSNAITVGGITAPAPISVTGGTYSIGCTATFTGVAASISNGETVCVQHTASAGFSTATDTVLTIGGVSDTFTSLTVAADTTPNAFTFTDQANVGLGSVVTSDTITVAGINAAASISVTGGTYSIGCTATFTAVTATLSNGETVCVRHTASANPATATNTVLTIGGVSDTFTSTTVPADTTPDAFAFTDVTNVALGSVQTSNAITVSGINTAAAISVTGGTYSIGCTATFTGTSSTINNGQSVCVRHTASANPATATNTVLTIGGVADTFTSTTVAADTTPDPFAFVDATNVALSSVQTSNAITVSGINTAAAISVTGGTYSIGCAAGFTAAAGTINNGQTVCVRHTASANPATATDTVLTIGGVSDTFTSTTVAVDTTPDAFAFTDVTNVALGSVQTSNPITVAGINSPAAISVTGGTYSIGCTGTFTGTASTINNGQSVCVRHTASATPGTATNTVLTIGGVSDTFTSTTVPPDTAPDAFTFIDVTDVALGSVQTSNAIGVVGINTAAPISVTGGTYSIGCTATFTAVAATINSGQAVCVRHTASATPATATNTVLTIGGVADTFTSTTVAADTTPDAFAFTDVTDVAVGSVQTSNAITVAGINAAAAISATGGTYSIGCNATFTAVAGTINNGQTVCVRHTASANPATATNTVLTIGGVSDTFTSITATGDTTPDAFTFFDVTNVDPGSVQTSNAITVAGINTAAAVSITGGTYSVGCNGTFTAAAGTINNGQTVCVRHTAPLALSATTNTVLTIGGVSDTFSSITVASLPPDGDFDNDGIPNAVESPESRNPFVKDNDVFNNSRLFAMQVYRDFLGREGEPGGIVYYTNLLNAGTVIRANVIESFFNSPEFAGTVSPVVRLYFATFRRIPDYPGLQFQVSAYRSGTPLNAIANNFTLSPEFQATYGALDNQQYVQLLYTNVLGRPASPPEIDFHVNRLVSGATRGDVLVGFSESPEYQTNTYNDVYVTMMYVGMLRRAPEQAGFDFWTNYMDTGNPGINLILGFLNAPEYRNRFLPPPSTLTVSKAGTGTGTVSSNPPGITCGADCTESYAFGTGVTLTAAPALGSTFTNWSGACTGTGTCLVTMDAAKSVSATFTLNTFVLTVSKTGTGTGTVSSNPAGIACGADCTETYDSGTPVTLNAAANVGSTFSGWGGACSGTGACIVTMDAARSVSAGFTLNTFALTVNKAGTGTGTVTSNPAGITCGADCDETYNFGASVTLTAAAGAGSTFSNWSGACSGSGSCIVTMDAAKSVSADFTTLNSNPACTSNQFLGSVSGDTGAGVLTTSGVGERWLRVRITEDDSGIFSLSYLSAKITLSSPPGADYDLYVYCLSCGGTLAGSSAGRAQNDVVDVRREDLARSDESFDVLIEVRYFGGSSGSVWNLSVAGNTTASTTTCQ